MPWQALTNGANIDPATSAPAFTASGATTDTVIISNPASGGRREVRLLLTNACGSATTNIAILDVSWCNCLDFNRDGISPDSADLDDFLAVFSGGPSACSTFPTPGCEDIDFNNDGISPDSSDLDTFISRLAGGPCF